MADDDLAYIELTEVARRIQARELSAVAVTQVMLDRIAKLDGNLGSYALVLPESALAQAQNADAEIAAGKIRGPLHGAPIAVKDLCWMKGVPTAAGMTIYSDFRPDDDATVVTRLQDAGAIILGRPSSLNNTAKEPVASGPLARRVFQRVGCRHRCRTLLRFAWFGHWRFDPFPVRCPRPDGAEAQLGPCKPLWRV
jgi:hypothetical protein